jgi:general secretion pathway protein M
MKSWFEGLEPREKLFIAVGGVLVLVALLYALVWVPLDTRHQNARSAVATWERALAELRPLRGMKLPASGAQAASAGVGGEQTPVVIVDSTLRARGLDRSLRRSQPTTTNGIRVEFENVAFDDLVLWLGDLSREYSMDATSGSFSTANRTEAGRVSATLTLERLL